MSPLVYLIGALVVSVIASGWYWYSQREPSTLESSIDAFNRGLDVLGQRVADPIDDSKYAPEEEPSTGRITPSPVDPEGTT